MKHIKDLMYILDIKAVKVAEKMNISRQAVLNGLKGNRTRVKSFINLRINEARMKKAKQKKIRELNEIFQKWLEEENRND